VATYYADSNAAGGGDGTIETPWNTVAAAQAAVTGNKAGSFLLFKCGSKFREAFEVGAYGTVGSPFTVGAYDTGALPIFDGSELIAGWTLDSGSIWKANVANAPVHVLFNGTVWGTKMGSKAACVSQYQWFWETGVIYAYAPGDPDTQYSSVEGSQRAHGVHIESLAYITVENVKAQKCASVGIRYETLCDHIIVQNCIGDYNYAVGIMGWATSTPTNKNTNCTIQFNVCSYNGMIGIDTAGGQDTTLIRYNTCHHNSQSVELTTSGGIYCVSVDNTNLIVEYNVSYRNGYKSDDVTIVGTGERGYGIWIDTTTGSIVRYNVSYLNYKSGLMVEKCPNPQVYYNLSFGNTGMATTRGLWVYNGDDAVNISTGGHFYNNVLYGNSIGIGVVSYTPGTAVMINNLFHNNIVFGNTQALELAGGAINDGTNGYGNVYEYNCFGPQAAGFIDWDGAAVNTYAAFEDSSHYNGNTHSVQVDPKMVDPANADFRLKPESTCINTGTLVSLIKDYIGKAVPADGAVDMGAYEHHRGGQWFGA